MNILRFNNIELTDNVVYSRNQIKDIAYNSKVSDEEKCAVLYQLGTIHLNRIVVKKVDEEYLKDLNIKFDEGVTGYIEIDLKLVKYMSQHKIIKYINIPTIAFNKECLRKMLIGDRLLGPNDIIRHQNFYLFLDEIDKMIGIDDWLIKVLLFNANIKVVK